MLIARYKAWRAKVALDHALRRIRMFSHEAVEMRRQGMEDVVYAKTSSGKSWQQFLDQHPPHNDVYRLYLHTQYMSYLLEDVRQRQQDLFLIAGGHPLNSWTPDEQFSSFESGSLNRYLFKMFCEEYIGNLMGLEEKRYPE